MNAASVFGGFCLLEGKVDMWMFCAQGIKEQDKRQPFKEYPGGCP
jgi:hypothetical protein